MSQKSVKKKDALKNPFSQYLKPEDDEIRAELEAMTALEYNLPGDPSEDTSDTPPSSSRRSRPSTKSSKPEKPMEPDRVLPRVEAESQIPFYSSTASARELQGIIRQAGGTSEDKYKILEARDRLMRLKQVKSHTLATAKKTRGTCPDMCPEKERLMREFQRQVASYEQVDCAEYRICHETAVKQYSRSSADQAEPLPQDLRPVISLKMTMSYLLHEIVDLCDEEGTNLAEWYHFVWDRTRGIRKDITLQDLCCLDTVELVEQCARFHIVCSERLCAEETAVFDKKINTENLTKCLQTLKYMYHDLRVQGISCKNEAEFRGYIILLNLDNTSFMWDLKELPKAIQSSPEVKFAIQVFSSIQSNNYTRFFKLVRRTTYLNACLMLRYFFQVRVKGLTVMVKAYCRTTSTAYPLYEFMDILGFDDENEAIAFCANADLNISCDELNIVLNRNNANLPPPVMDEGRATSLVEAKRMKMGYSYGQAIAGGVMPEQIYLDHKPHNSFDDQGYLKTEAVNASDQNRGIGEGEEGGEERDPYEYMEEDVEEAPPPLRRKTFGLRVEEDNGEVEQKDEEVEEEDVEEETEEDEEEYDDADDGENEVVPTTKSIIFSSLSFTSGNIFSNNFKFSTVEAIDSKMSIESPFIPKSGENNPFGGKPGLSFPGAQQPSIFAKPDVPKPSGKTGGRPSTFGDRKPGNESIFSGASQGNIFAKPVPVSTPPLLSVSDVNQKTKNTFKAPQPAKPRESPTKKRTESELAEEKRRQQEEELRRKSLAREQRLQEIEENTKKCANEIETEVIHDMCSTILKELMERAKVFERLSQKISDDLIKEVIREDCMKALDEELYIQKRLHEVAKRVENRIVLKCYRIWQRNAMKKREQRKALDNTPVWLPRYSLEACAQSLYRKDQDLVIQNMRRRSNKSGNEDNLKYISPVELKIYSGLKENAKTLDTDPTPIMFWKAVVSWPLLKKRVLLWRYKNIMNQYLCPGDSRMDPIIKTYKPNPYETLNICIKHCEGIAGEDDVMGMDGLFFIAMSDEDPKEVVRRLTKTVLSRQKLMPIPLVFIILGKEGNCKGLEPKSELDNLLRSEYISEYTVHREKMIDEDSILKLTQTAILWLSMNRSTPIPLEMDYLKDVVENCLTDELWLRIAGHAPFNAALKAATDDPKFIVDLHNEAVGRLMDVILDPESLMYTDFPAEFKPLLPKDFDVPCSYEYFDEGWKGEENRGSIESILEGFILPPWPFNWPIDNTMKLHKCVIRYCNTTLGGSNYEAISCNILSNIFFMSNSTEKPNFVHVLTEIIKEKIRLVAPDLSVVYDKNHIKLFRTLPWWFKSNIFLTYEAQMTSLVEPHETSVVKRRRLEEEADKENQEISMVIEEFDNISDRENSGVVKSFLEESKNQLSHVQSITDKLETLLEKQRLANKKFEEKLEAALRSEQLFDF
ncbi:uncharacterized protein LOC107048344 [Diachasma alloeum]|uniref:uncharacterized protein LOC107048344 n=1 Tax=Diachasma alloeum TaxID=454923 RepID=UPI00073845AB|nr:uncharacterized protein LOC107048344 [Diachasma alloeum]